MTASAAPVTGRRAHLDAADLAPLRPWREPWWRATPGDGPVLFYMILIHVLTVVGLIVAPLPGWPIFAAAYLLHFLGGIGTTVAYHRAIAHRSVKLHPVAAPHPDLLRDVQRLGCAAELGRLSSPAPRQVRHARGHLQPARRRFLVVAPALALAGGRAAHPEVLQGDRSARLSLLGARADPDAGARGLLAGCLSAGRPSSGSGRCAWSGRCTRSASSTASATWARSRPTKSRRRRTSPGWR